ncbi:MAG: hypothetical protein IPK82_44270 [Polyangiaceae bacterium]|nr:hypothetical protein [Polyangiaceae bacterium]
MSGYGWNYLLVKREQTPARWVGSDGCVYPSETEMFYELGATGWELVAIRGTDEHEVYYFKRPRA